MLRFLRRIFSPNAGCEWPLHRPAPQPSAAQPRYIETEHFRFVARQPAPRKLWHVKVEPLSAAARYWAQAEGYDIDHPIETTLPLDHLGAYVDHLHANLAAHWGPALDTHKDWEKPRKRRRRL